jgi:hypothetical protein
MVLLLRGEGNLDDLETMESRDDLEWTIWMMPTSWRHGERTFVVCACEDTLKHLS